MKKENIVVKYIRLYFNNTITKCVANAIQISRLFLGGMGLQVAGAIQDW